MKLAVMQPYFFPYIGYFQLIKAVDKILLYEKLGFMKKTWMTRNRILIKNGGPNYIQVPVQAKSSYKKISEIFIAPDRKWKTTILKTLQCNYGPSRHFAEVFPVLSDIINTAADTLHGYNSSTISAIAGLLAINTRIEPDNGKYLYLENELDGKI